MRRKFPKSTSQTHTAAKSGHNNRKNFSLGNTRCVIHIPAAAADH